MPRPRSGAVAGRSYPMPEDRGGGRECQAATAQEQPRGATPGLRSGAAAESARLRRRRSSREELPQARDQGLRPRVPGCEGAGAAKRNYQDRGQGWWLGGATPCPRSGAAAGRHYHMPEARGGCRECQAAMAQEQQSARPQRRSSRRVPGGDGEGAAERSYPRPEARGGSREALTHARGQGWRPGGATPRPRPWVSAWRSYPMPEDRGGGREELPHARGRGWGGLEELPHARGHQMVKNLPAI